MKFRSLPQSLHPLVELRPLAERDLGPWAGYLNLPAVYEHTSWNHPTPDELATYLGSEQNEDPSHRLRLAIALREPGTLVGTIGFHSVSPANRSAEIAFDLEPDFWGKGLATAVGTTLVHWAHSEADMHRVQATVLESNVRSVRALERMAFAREGLLRDYRVVRGRAGNFFMYSHLVGDAGGA